MRPFVIINAGDREHASPRMLKKMEAILASGFDRPILRRCESIGQTAELVRQAQEEGCDTVLAGGGDGTLNVVLNHLRGTNLNIGILPLGTVNCFARGIGLSTKPLAACRQLLKGALRPVQIGRINEWWFLCFVSIGVDAALVHSCNLRLKKYIGAGAFVISGLTEWLTMRGSIPFRVDGDWQSDCSHTIMISQVENYGGFNIFRGARPDAGELQAFILNRRSRADHVRMLMDVLSWNRAGFDRHAHIDHFRFRGIQILANQPLFVQIDGEPVNLENSQKLEIESLPDPIQCLMPARQQS